jgi:hypothetical protein
VAETRTATFSITTPSTTAKLDANRKAQAAFTVANASIQPLSGRARVVAIDGAKPEWFTIDGNVERAFASSGIQQYVVQVNVPATAPAGKYKFQLKVVGVANPDEQYGESQQVAFEVPEAVKKSTPLPMWIWIVAAVVALLILGGIALGFYLANRKPTASFDTASVDFGNQAVGSLGGLSASKTVTVKSTGPVDLHVKSVSISGGNAGEFHKADSCSGKTVASGKTCTIVLAFLPAATGPRSGSLVFTLDTQSGSQSIPLKGQGAQPQLSLTPIPPNPLIVQSAYSGTVTVKNTGTIDLHVTKVQAVPPWFSIVNDGCSGRAVPPQQSCLITVSSQPGLPLRGSLVIVSDGGQQVIQLMPG